MGHVTHPFRTSGISITNKLSATWLEMPLSVNSFLNYTLTWVGILKLCLSVALMYHVTFGSYIIIYC